MPETVVTVDSSQQRTGAQPKPASSLSWIQCNVSYFVTLPGILKIIQLVRNPTPSNKNIITQKENIIGKIFPQNLFSIKETYNTHRNLIFFSAVKISHKFWVRQHKINRPKNGVTSLARALQMHWVFSHFPVPYGSSLPSHGLLLHYFPDSSPKTPSWAPQSDPMTL